MLKRVNHIGLAVKDLSQAMKFWNTIFGVDTPAPIVERDMKICMMKVGDVLVELLAPVGSDGLIAKFLEKKGEGIHHICYEVENIYDAVEEMKAKGMALVSDQPREGAEGKIVFLHPKGTAGVLTELVQVR